MLLCGMSDLVNIYYLTSFFTTLKFEHHVRYSFQHFDFIFCCPNSLIVNLEIFVEILT